MAVERVYNTRLIIDAYGHPSRINLSYINTELSDEDSVGFANTIINVLESGEAGHPQNRFYREVLSNIRPN